MIDSLMSFDDTFKKPNISTLVSDFLTKGLGRESVRLELVYASMFYYLSAYDWQLDELRWLAQET